MALNRLIAGAVAGLTIIALGAVAASVAVQISSANAEPAEVLSVAKASKAKYPPKKCADCGVVVAVKEIEEARYEMQILMSDGSLKTVTSALQPIWKKGDMIRLQNGKVVG
jgi:hypothetical protein